MRDDLDNWLVQIGLGEYIALFAENAIDSDVLPDLTDADLKEIGVPLGHRKKLLKAIAGLNREDLELGPTEDENFLQAPGQKSSATDAERRQLSVMFCDLVGSTTLSEQLDLEIYREILGKFQDAARNAIARYNGYIARYMGDGILVYFGYPTAHEDDAERAVRAGLDVVQAVSSLAASGDVTLQTRVGIATGPVVAGDIVGEGASEEHAVLGETPNLAARLQGLAQPDCVIISETTQRLTEGRFEFEALERRPVKGFREAIQAFKVETVRDTSRFEAATIRGLSHFVGRQIELQLLLDRWDRVNDGEGQVVLLSGEAGIGKSRILQEFRDDLGNQPHILVRYQCSPYSTQTAFSAIIDQLQHAACFTQEDSVPQKLDKLEGMLASVADNIDTAASLLAPLLSLPGDRYASVDMSPQRQKIETISLQVTLLEQLAKSKSVLILAEDVHWIDPSTRETFDAMIDRVQSLRVLMVMTHRPEFQSPWQRHGHVTHHSLNRLKRSDAKALTEQVTGGIPLPDPVLDQILEHTDGVPLFIEELTKTVLEGGLLRKANGRYVMESSEPSFAIPATLRDSLMARLDRLAPVREVAQAASCIGREFSVGLLSLALPQRSVEADLDQLVEAGLIFRRGMGSNERYIFKHALVQDTAYESLLVSKRRQLHARIATALESWPEPDSGVLAQHYSAAGMPEKAAGYFLDAGKRALAVSALQEAGSKLEFGLREIGTIPPSPKRDRLELDLRVLLGAAKLAYFGWPHPSVGAAFVPAFQLAEKLGDRQALGPILWGICVHYWCRAEFPETHRWLGKLEEAAERSEDSELSAVRDMSAGCQYFWEAQYERAYRYTTHIRGIYEETHARVTEYTNHDPLTFSLQWAGSLLQWVIGRPDLALELTDETHALARRIGHPFNSAFALTAGSEALIMRGDTERVLECCDEVQRIIDDEGLGDFAQHVLVDNWRGRTYTRMGEFEIGYRLTNLATTRWRQAEGKICSAMFWSGEAIALAGLGRMRDALELIDAAISHCRETGDRYMEPEVLRVKAQFMLADGEAGIDAAEALLLESLQIAQDHQAKSWELRGATSLAELWRSREKRSEARDVLAPVYDWFTEGFGTADLKDARALLESLD